MMRIELDLYSGRENPSFTVETDFAQRLLRQNANREADPRPDYLGFRGALLSPLSDDTGLLNSEGLYISAASEALGKNAETLLDLLGKIPQNEPEFDDDLMRYLHACLSPAANGTTTILSTAEDDSKGLASPEVKMACPIEVGAFNPGFWNAPLVIGKNNCYNYATNRRTDTFAQPGRATGNYPYPMACDRVRAAAISDGAKYGPTPSGFSVCQPDSEKPRWFMALVVWPGRDYHWYRKQKEGFWGHKPGGTAARNTDNSNKIISNPETCDRGPYTNFCGWFISGKSSKVK